MTVQEIEENSFLDFFGVSEDLVPIRPRENLGNSELTFDGLLDSPGLQVYEDGGASGCGGKLWPAGELLSRYMIHLLNGDLKKIPCELPQEGGKLKFHNVVELGSGTGLVG